MTQEDKQLLLKDLCARLPYGVKINIYDDYSGTMKDENLNVFHLDSIYNIEYKKLRPYLRSMLSMTEKEKEEFEKISNCYLYTIILKRDRKGKVVEQKAYFDNERPSSGAFGDDGDCRYFNQENFIKTVNLLLAHHLDFRGLIPMGLALEAPVDMYKND